MSRTVTHGCEGNIEQINIFISAYDADKTELIIEK